MKCSACGKEFDEGFAYCPWCGNNATTRDDVAALRRIAAEEKLRDLRRDEIGWGVVGALGLIGGAVLVALIGTTWTAIGSPPADLAVGFTVGIGLVFVLGIVGLVLSYRKSKQRKDFVSRLEKGKFE